MTCLTSTQATRRFLALTGPALAAHRHARAGRRAAAARARARAPPGGDGGGRAGTGRARVGGAGGPPGTGQRGRWRRGTSTRSGRPVGVAPGVWAVSRQHRARPERGGWGAAVGGPGRARPLPGVRPAVAAPVVVAAGLSVVDLAAVALLLPRESHRAGARGLTSSVRQCAAGGRRGLAPPARLPGALEVSWGLGMVAFESLTPVRLAEILGGTSEAGALPPGPDPVSGSLTWSRHRVDDPLTRLTWSLRRLRQAGSCSHSHAVRPARSSCAGSTTEGTSCGEW